MIEFMSVAVWTVTDSPISAPIRRDSMVVVGAESDTATIAMGAIPIYTHSKTTDTRW